MAIPSAVLTYIVATLLQQSPAKEWLDNDTSTSAQMVGTAFSSIMIFILYNRSSTAYDRWWEGGTLLQKTRGEWFNAYSSIMAFTSTAPDMQHQVDSYCCLLARWMSLLMCCGLQQVSPERDRPFEIINLDGIEKESMEFLNSAPDKVEIILQWIQRSIVLQMKSGVLPAPAPILSRAFQELSRGIVNLQNARKIADFPYPYPLAQISMILQLLHWAMMPIWAALAAPRGLAVLLAFLSIFVLWCIHFNALDLEFPFGSRENDLPMRELQEDFNNSICMLLDKRGAQPPTFQYDPEVHDELSMVMSDASDLYVPVAPPPRAKLSIIKFSDKATKKKVFPRRSRSSVTLVNATDSDEVMPQSSSSRPSDGGAATQPATPRRKKSDPDMVASSVYTVARPLVFAKQKGTDLSESKTTAPAGSKPRPALTSPQSGAHISSEEAVTGQAVL
eukprot:CAMPEP_0117483278 /NCGR_PEP_ID=MMETSP0784-20121206/13856_1 /TAXON_ID=39447 /ORGANISM="" /LENGTH=446 /DNA_ID=CAMNT_0005277807 /DNA_START=79 /DNA_END=1419 /DNA_ORIENTATION=+